LLLTLDEIILRKIVYIFALTPFESDFFNPYQQRLREEILELDSSANQARDNKLQTENEIKVKRSSLARCKER
jgi:hypothetical protein